LKKGGWGGGGGGKKKKKKREILSSPKHKNINSYSHKKQIDYQVGSLYQYQNLTGE